MFGEEICYQTGPLRRFLDNIFNNVKNFAHFLKYRQKVKTDSRGKLLNEASYRSESHIFWSLFLTYEALYIGMFVSVISLYISFPSLAWF